MKVQRVFRVAVCAALVALCVAGAGSYPAKSLAGQETRRIAIDQDRTGGFQPMADPFLTSPQKLISADGVIDDMFGSSVAISGDTLAVGAWGGGGASSRDGSVHMYTRSGGSWTLQQKIVADDTDPYDSFGGSIALSGDTLIVGASGDSIGAHYNRGSAYVFTRTGAVWTQQQKLTASDGGSSDSFGISVSMSGNTLIVGAAQDDIGTNTDQGSAYVFTENAGVWTEQQKLTDVFGGANYDFGYGVAAGDDTVAVGSYGDSSSGNHWQGAVFVFARTGTAWTLQQKITASDGAADDSFGVNLSLAGDLLAVGAPGDHIGTISGRGSVYLFTRIGSSWMQQQKLIANDGDMYDRFGRYVSLEGDSLAIGAPGDTIGSITRQGSAYVFTRNGAVWGQAQKLIAGDGATEDYFGTVALGSDTVVVGAELDDIGTNENQGSAYVFARPPCPAIVLLPLSLPNGPNDVWYQQSMTVGGGFGSYQFTVTSGALPPGLSLGSSGLLSGMPTTVGIYQFTIRATDASGLCSASRAYTIRITPPCSELKFVPSPLPNGVKGLLYIEQLTAGGGSEPYRFSKRSGILPPGLSLSMDGVVSGTPTRTGNFNFTVLIMDATGCFTEQATSIAITVRRF